MTAPVIELIVPNLLVSRGKPVFASAGSAAAVNDGVYAPGPCWSARVSTPAEPAWVALQVGVGPSRVLVSWTAPASHDYTEARSGAPRAYRIESSADSTNGADGAWRLELSVADNGVRSRAHIIEYDGQSWVRLVVTGAADPAGSLSLAEIDVHDASDGTDDAWLFLGDGAGPFAEGGRSFAERVHAEYPGYFPAMLDAGVRGELTTTALTRLGEVLAQSPDFRFVALAYGTSDARSDIGAARFRADMRAIVERVMAAGRVPVLARVPFSPEGDDAVIRDYNHVIEAIEREQGLLSGPDLYAWFKAHPEQLTEGGYAGAAGRAAIQRLWAEAMDALYAPQ